MFSRHPNRLWIPYHPSLRLAKEAYFHRHSLLSQPIPAVPTENTKRLVVSKFHDFSWSLHPGSFSIYSARLHQDRVHPPQQHRSNPGNICGKCHSNSHESRSCRVRSVQRSSLTSVPSGTDGESPFTPPWQTQGEDDEGMKFIHTVSTHSSARTQFCKNFYH